MAKKKRPNLTPEEEAAFEARTRWINEVLARARERTLAEQEAQERADRRRERLRRLLRLS
jgi:uncharacterized protein YnzC (UPF0291/DUF896 family)